MKERYAIMIKLPECDRSYFRCFPCKINTLLRYFRDPDTDNEGYWFALRNFRTFCPEIKETDTKPISKTKAQKILMAMRI